MRSPGHAAPRAIRRPCRLCDRDGRGRMFRMGITSRHHYQQRPRQRRRPTGMPRSWPGTPTRGRPRRPPRPGRNRHGVTSSPPTSSPACAPSARPRSSCGVCSHCVGSAPFGSMGQAARCWAYWKRIMFFEPGGSPCSSRRSPRHRRKERKLRRTASPSRTKSRRTLNKPGCPNGRLAACEVSARSPSSKMAGKSSLSSPAGATQARGPSKRRVDGVGDQLIRMPGEPLEAGVRREAERAWGTTSGMFASSAAERRPRRPQRSARWLSRSVGTLFAGRRNRPRDG